MGKIVKCRECGKVYRELDELEDLRDNDSTCLACNNVIEVADWDRVLASFEDEDETDDEEDEDDWDEDSDEDDDADEDDEDLDEEEDLDEDLDEEDDEDEDD